MSDQWHYRLLGEEFGPVSAEMLQSLIDGGTLSEADEVRRVGTEQWVSAAAALKASSSGGTVTATATTADPAESELQWYCRVAGQELGPLAFDDLVRFAENGELTADEEVRFGADGKWRRVGSIGRLVSVLPYHEASTLRPSQTAPPDRPAERAAETPPPTAVEPQYHPSAEQTIWTAWIRGAEYGPASLVQLSQWLTAGQLNPADMVRQGPTGQWLPAASIPQMLAQLVVPAAAPVPVPAAPPAAPKPESRPEPKPARQEQPATASRPKESPAATATKREIDARDTAPYVTTQPAPKEAPKREPAPVADVPAPAAARPSYSPPAAAASSGWSAKPAPIKSPPKKAARERSDGPSIFESLKQPKALAAIGVIAFAVLFLFGGSLIPRSSAADRKKLETLQNVLAEFRSLREQKASQSDWDAFATKTKEAVAPMVEELKKTANRNAPAKQYLLWASRDRLPEMLQSSRDKQTAAELDFEKNLHEAAVNLGLEERSPAPPPEETEGADGAPQRPD